jgi:predicted metal-dependent hydrolase
MNSFQLMREVFIEDKIIVHKRNVKYPRIEVTFEGIKVIVPLKKNVDVESIIKKHSKWICKKIILLNKYREEIRNLSLYNYTSLNELILKYIGEYAEKLKVRPNKILFRKMRARWGSCYVKNKVLIFNKALRYLPEDLVQYVVLHEMAHLIVPNHSKNFRELICQFDKRAHEKENLLKLYAYKLLCYSED